MLGDYEVESVLKKRIFNGEIQYRIKWVGYPSNQNTWEPAHHLTKETIDEFEQLEKTAYLDKVRKETEKKMKQLHPDNIVFPFEIHSHFINNEGELAFKVTSRGKKTEMNRKQVIKDHAEELGRYYIEQAKQRGIY
jgi:Tfp pilus assembly protein PilP